MLSNCGVREDSWESLGLQGDPTSPSWRNSVLNNYWKDWYRRWTSNPLATWCEKLTHWKRPWCCERMKAGGEGGDRGWDGWMASPTRWTWVWASSGSWWWTGRPGVLQSTGSQRLGHDWVTELNCWGCFCFYSRWSWGSDWWTDLSSCKWQSLEAKPRPVGSKPHGLSRQPSASSGRLFCAGLLALWTQTLVGPGPAWRSSVCWGPGNSWILHSWRMRNDAKATAGPIQGWQGRLGNPDPEAQTAQRKCLFPSYQDTQRVEVTSPKLHLEEKSRSEHRSSGCGNQL